MVFAMPLNFKLFEFKDFKYLTLSGTKRLWASVELPCSNLYATDWGVVFETKNEEGSFSFIWAQAMSSCEYSNEFKEYLVPLSVWSQFKEIKNLEVSIPALRASKISDVQIIESSKYIPVNEGINVSFALNCLDTHSEKYVDTKVTYDDSGDQVSVVGHLFFKNKCKLHSDEINIFENNIFLESLDEFSKPMIWNL